MMNLTEKSIYPFFESIRLFDGKPQLLKRHQQRVDHVFSKFYPGQSSLDLRKCIQDQVTDPLGLVKCRIAYSSNAYQLACRPYEFRKIHRLIPIPFSVIYSFKHSDRDKLESVRRMLNRGEEALICHGDRLQDTTYSNIALSINDVWYTPQYPLFYGVMRDHHLQAGDLVAKDLFLSDIQHCVAIKLINAMMPMDSCITLTLR